MATTVLIVDDHAGFRRAARSLLEADGYDVAGESATGGEALEAVPRLRPNVVLLDIGLPDLDGIEVSTRLTTEDPTRAIVLTSTRDATECAPLAKSCGARGFIPKSELSGAAIAQLAV
ncbi:response regulator [Candidatus Solirubrobacter pratensis]|uniref:response regulator n=1 Tax=Candidatus Solirubrobacter pratensis TaxID=1298857 RepID=UPI00040DC165|nr:response regulator transcription factor [Candidatus Solirubrobacter pratensis]